jgi:peptide/nickel transport system ATP-binding protein
MGALLALEALSVSLAGPEGKVPILTDLSFTIGSGETIGLVGESGSGKSMTALAIMGLLPDHTSVSGRLIFDGADLLRQSEAALCDLRGRRIAMVFQEPMTALNPLRTIGAQVAESLILHKRLSRAAAERRATGLLARVGMPAPRFSPALYPHQLSGGQRQRVMIAMALACKPDLLIADEPTTALDVTIQAQILDLLAGLAREEGMALLLITHDLGVVSEMTERVLVMYAGRVVEEGRTEAVFRRMAHPYTRGLFSASPHTARALATPGARMRLAAIPGQLPEPRDRPPYCAFADRCPRVEADCRAGVPPLQPIEDVDHRAACLHPYGGGA